MSRKKKKRLQLEAIGNNIFKHEDEGKKFLVRQVVSGWQVEEYLKIDEKWENQMIWTIKSLGGIVLEIDDDVDEE